MFRDDGTFYSQHGDHSAGPFDLVFMRNQVRFLGIFILLSLVFAVGVAPFGDSLWLYWTSGLEGIYLYLRSVLTLNLDWYFFQVAIRGRF